MQDITRQIGIALRWLPLVVVVALASALIAYSWSSGKPEVYEATGRLLVKPGLDYSVQDLAVAESAAFLYADLAKSLTIADKVVDELRLDESARSLLRRIDSEASEETFEVIISARDRDASQARAIANSVGRQLRLHVKDTVITDDMKAVDNAITKNKENIRTLQARLNRLEAKPNKIFEEWSQIVQISSQISLLQNANQDLRPSSKEYARNLLEWFEAPVTPADPVEPRPLYWTLLALVVGGMFAAGVAYVLEYLRSHGKVRDEQDLEAATGLLPLGAVAETKRDARRGGPARLVMLRYPRSDAAEAYRGLLGRIGFAGGTARTLLIASSSESDAKSVVAANLALAYAEAGRNVILVDADYRAPRLHSFFEVRNDRGLTTILADNDVPLGWVTVATSHPRLGLMPAGPPPTEISDPLGSPQLATLLRRLLHAADMVVFDSPSMSGNLDAAVLATHVQESLLVVTAGATEQEADDAARALHGAEADLVGAVLYRTVRRSRRGQRRAVLPPPAGQAPQPAPSLPRRIPVSIARPDPATGKAPPDKPASAARPMGPAAPAPGPSAPRAPGGNGAGPAPNGKPGPYTVPFEPEKSTPER